MNKVLYRYEIYYKNEDGDTEVKLRELPVIRETEKCYFIKRGYDERRVLKEARNTYAYTTKYEAKEHFLRRTQRRIDWFEFWKEECEKALKLIKAEPLNE